LYDRHLRLTRDQRVITPQWPRAKRTCVFLLAPILVARWRNWTARLLPRLWFAPIEEERGRSRAVQSRQHAAKVSPRGVFVPTAVSD